MPSVVSTETTGLLGLRPSNGGEKALFFPRFEGLRSFVEITL